MQTLLLVCIIDTGSKELLGIKVIIKVKSYLHVIADRYASIVLSLDSEGVKGRGSRNWVIGSSG